jgi:outer membrane receptor protein involved in Fe transport
MKIRFLGVLIHCLLATSAFGAEEDLVSVFGDEDMVSLATGKQQPIAVAPAVTTVITAKDIKDIGANSLEEVLETVPGLHVGLNNFYDPVYTIRGIFSHLNPQVLVLINEIPITNLYLGSRGLAWGGMPIETISRIEIIRGPGSAIYGADAFAGVINIITKSQQEGTETGVQYGSFDSMGAWMTHGGKIGDFDSFFAFEYSQTDGYRQIIESDLQSIFDSLDDTHASLAPGPVNLSHEVYNLRFELSQGHWQLRAGVLEHNNVGTGAGAAEALDPSGRIASSRDNFDITFHDPNFSDNWDFSSQLSYYYTTQEIEKDIVLFPPGSEFGMNTPPFSDGVIGNPEVYENHWRFNISAFYEGFEKHQVRIGTGYHNADIYKVKESKNFGVDANGNPIFPGSPVVSVDDTSSIFLPEGDRNDKFLFAQDVWRLSGDWELTYGVRYDDYSDFGSTTNPRAALVWSTSHNLTTKLLYGEAFRPPSFADSQNQNNPVALGNPDIKPEEIETTELAFDYRTDYNSRIGLNLFKYDWNDIIDFYPDLPPASTRTARNLGKQSGKGAEIEAEWEMSKALQILGNYTYQESIDENTDSATADAPKRQFYIRAKWVFSEDWYTTLQLKAVKDRSREFGDIRPPTDDYKLVTLNLSYDPDAKPWELRLIARNVFNEDAREPSSPVIMNDFPLAGRNYFMEFRYQR